MPHGLSRLAARGERRAEAVVRLAGIRLEAYGLTQVHDRIVDPATGPQCIRQIQLDLLVLWVEA